MFSALLLLVGPSLCLAVTRVEVVKSWSAVVTEVSIEHWCIGIGGPDLFKWLRPFLTLSTHSSTVDTIAKMQTHQTVWSRLYVFES